MNRIRAATSAFVISILSTGVSLAGDWTLLYNFEGEDALEGVFKTVYVEGFGELQLHPDPMNAQNTVLYVESGGYGVQNHNTVHATFQIPPIEVGTTVTYYMRYFQAGASNSFHWNFTPVPVGQDSAGRWEPRVFGQYEMIVRHGLPADPSLVEIYNATRYNRLGTMDGDGNFVPFVHVDNVWYEYWLVIVNDTDPFEDRYYLYVRGGQFPEVTHLKVELLDIDGVATGEYMDFAYMRNGVEEPLRTMAIVTQSGWQDNPFAGDHFYVDDIHVADGRVFTSPVGDPDPVTIWNGFLLNEDSVANTRGWMGMVFVPNPDLNWGLAESLESWVYIATSDSQGGWVYRVGDWIDSLELLDPDHGWAYSMILEEWVYIGGGDNSGGWVYKRK